MSTHEYADAGEAVMFYYNFGHSTIVHRDGTINYLVDNRLTPQVPQFTVRGYPIICSLKSIATRCDCCSDHYYDDPWAWFNRRDVGDEWLCAGCRYSEDDDDDDYDDED